MKSKMLWLVLLISIGLVGCGSKKETSNETGGKKVRPIVVASGNFNGDFYSGWTNSSYDNDIRRLVWGEGLFTPTPTGELVKSQWVEKLVTKKSDPSKENDDIWEFTLKNNLKFSNGDPMTVEDVKFSYDFFLNAKDLQDTGATTTLPERLDRVEIDKEARKVTFYLKEVVYIIDIMFETHIWDSNMIKQGAEKEGMTVQQWVKANISKPIGTGPYKIDEYIPSQYVKLSINENYQGNFEGEKPSIPILIMQFIPEETKITQLVSGEIDVVVGLSSEENIDTILREKSLTTRDYYRHGGGQLTFHTDFGPAQLVEVRKAYSYMLDRIKFRNIFLGKYAISTEAPYSRNMWMMYDDDEKLGTQSRFEKTLTSYDILDADGNWDEEANIKEAHRLLDQAVAKTNGEYAKLTKVNGKYLWENKPLELNMAMINLWVDALNLTLTKDVQEKFGIKVNIEGMDWSILANNLYGNASLTDRKYHIFAGGTSYVKKSDYTYMRGSLILPYGQGTTSNTTRFPIKRAILDRMRNANPTSEEGHTQYKQAFRDFITEMNTELPQLPMYSNIYYDAFPTDIVDLETSPMWQFPYAVVKAKFKAN